MTSSQEPANTSDRTASAETTPLPPFDSMMEAGAVPGAEYAPTQPSRWRRGHTVAAAVVVAVALVSGGAAAGAHYAGPASTDASGQPTAELDESEQEPPAAGDEEPSDEQDPLANLGQLDVGQLDGLLNQLSDGQLDSEQLRALLAMLGLPDHVDAGQLQDLLQQLDGAHLLDGAGDAGSGVET